MCPLPLSTCGQIVNRRLVPLFHLIITPTRPMGGTPTVFFTYGEFSRGMVGRLSRYLPARRPFRCLYSASPGPWAAAKEDQFRGIWLDTSPTQKLALPLPLVLAFHCRGWHAAILWLLLARRGRLGAACAVVAPASALAASAAACAPEPVLLCCCAAPSAASDDSHRCAARRGGTHPATSCHPPKSVLPPATAPKSQHRGLQHNPPPTPARR